METILTNALVPGYPSHPGFFLFRAKESVRFPFAPTKVRRRFWLFGSLGFRTSYGWRKATSWPVQFWRVPGRPT
jgi:hypothetical protein